MFEDIQDATALQKKFNNVYIYFMQIGVKCDKNVKLKNCCQMIKDTRKKPNRNIHIKY